MKNSNNRVILLTGPSGVGKTTLAEIISANDDWFHVSEDQIWCTTIKNRPKGRQRTDEEEDIVQDETFRIVINKLEFGNVVLDFILYKNPPKPVIFYKQNLEIIGIKVTVIFLHANIDVLLNRQSVRGRITDQNIESQYKFATEQLTCVNNSHIDNRNIIDTTFLSTDEVYLKIKNDFL